MEDSTLSDSELTSYLATIAPVVVKSLKRSRELSGSEDEESDPSLVLPPSKRRKLDLKKIIIYKSPRFVLTRKKPAKSGRPNHGLPSTRRFVQKPATPQVTVTAPPRAEPARASPGPPPPRMLDDGPPAGCGFTIYEETADEEMGNLFTHSVSTLDISDESSRAAKTDQGMENVEPATATIGDPAPSSPRNPLTPRRRTPLGGLNAESFATNGIGAEPSILAPAEDEEKDEIL